MVVCTSFVLMIGLDIPTSAKTYVSTFNCMCSLWNTTLLYTALWQVVDTIISTACSTALLQV